MTQEQMTKLNVMKAFHADLPRMLAYRSAATMNPRDSTQIDCMIAGYYAGLRRAIMEDERPKTEPEIEP